MKRDEVVEVLVALRALTDGTEDLEPNRSHILSIARVLTKAIERGAEETDEQAERGRVARGADR